MFIKIKGFNDFFEVTYRFETSLKGHKWANVEHKRPVSRSEYYAQPAENRHIVDQITDFPEYCNRSFFKKLTGGQP